MVHKAERACDSSDNDGSAIQIYHMEFSLPSSGLFDFRHGL